MTPFGFTRVHTPAGVVRSSAAGGTDAVHLRPESATPSSRSMPIQPCSGRNHCSIN